MSTAAVCIACIALLASAPLGNAKNAERSEERIAEYFLGEAASTVDMPEYRNGKDMQVEVKMVTITEQDMIYNHDTEVSAVIDLVNQNRLNAGLTPLVRDEKLMEAANQRATEIATKFSHTRTNETSCFTVLDDFQCDYWCAGENIAFGQRHASWVVEDWMNSPSHRANIMYEDYGRIGIGLYESSDGTLYWTQIFTD